MDESEFGYVLGDSSQSEFVDRGELERDLTCPCVYIFCLASSFVDMILFALFVDVALPAPLLATLPATFVDITLLVLWRVERIGLGS